MHWHRTFGYLRMHNAAKSPKNKHDCTRLPVWTLAGFVKGFRLSNESIQR